MGDERDVSKQLGGKNGMVSPHRFVSLASANREKIEYGDSGGRISIQQGKSAPPSAAASGSDTAMMEEVICMKLIFGTGSSIHPYIYMAVCIHRRKCSWAGAVQTHLLTKVQIE